MQLLKKQALSYLKDYRLKHTLYCEKAAVLLSKHYRVDSEKSKLAALFHDITKELTFQEQIILCKKYNIKNSIINSNNWKLIHGHTAAEISRHKYKLDNDIYYAIKWHSTGHSKMNNISKILYIADYIEDTRKIEGILELKKNIYEKKISLDDAMIYCLNLSIKDLINKNKNIDLNTILARNTFIDNNYNMELLY